MTQTNCLVVTLNAREEQQLFLEVRCQQPQVDYLSDPGTGARQFGLRPGSSRNRRTRSVLGLCLSMSNRTTNHRIGKMAAPTDSIVPSGVCRPSSTESLTPLLLRAPNAAALCNISIRTWRTWDSTGKTPRPIRIGRKVFWRPDELKAWVTAGCPDRITWEAMQES